MFQIKCLSVNTGMVKYLNTIHGFWIVAQLVTDRFLRIDRHTRLGLTRDVPRGQSHGDTRPPSHIERRNPRNRWVAVRLSGVPGWQRRRNSAKGCGADVKKRVVKEVSSALVRSDQGTCTHRLTDREGLSVSYVHNEMHMCHRKWIYFYVGIA